MGRQGVGDTGRRGHAQRVHHRYCVIMESGRIFHRCCAIMESVRVTVWFVAGEDVLTLKEGTRIVALYARPVQPVRTRKGDTREAVSSVGRGLMCVLLLKARGRTRVSYVAQLCAVSM